MNVQVRCNTGVTPAYSLKRLQRLGGLYHLLICFNGTKGRLEHNE